jgi:hypothetical protein
MASIQEELRSVLGADADLGELVADRIYPGQIPDDDDPTPWLYYSVPESVPFDALDTPTDVRSEVEFHALAETYAGAKAIIDAVFSTLNTYTGTVIKSAFWEGTSEDSTDDGYHHVARFSMMWVAT